MRLLLNNVPVTGSRSSEIVSSRGSQASSFRVLGSLRDLTRQLGAGWFDQDQLPVAIDYGFLPIGASEGQLNWVRMVTGTVDRIGVDPVSGLVSLDGRDNASRLIDLPLQDGYLNKTSSEVAQSLASRCGLESDVDQTSGLVGQYYQIQHARSALASASRYGNGWDLLAELADLEGYDLWVDQTTLYFKETVSVAGDIFDVTYDAPGLASASAGLTISHLSMERAFGLAGPIQVAVSSWNSRQRRQVTASYPSAGTAESRRFQVVKPNLLADEAETLAKNTYGRLRAHERVISATMAGELALTPRSRLRLSGTNTGWDQIYTIDRIEREMSLESGFTQHLTARVDTSGDNTDG